MSAFGDRSPPSPNDAPARRAGRQRIVGWALAPAATLAILVATLSPGDPAVLEQTSLLCIVCGSQGGADVLLNVLLFVPLGLALVLAGTSLVRAAVATACLSFAVEAAQLLVLSGRDPSLSDLIFNTMGGVLGAAVGSRWRLLLLPTPREAVHLASFGVAAAIAVLAASGWALVPELPPPPYAVNQITTAPGAIRQFEGAIVRSVLNAREYPSPTRVHEPLRTTMLPPLHADALLLEAEVHAMPPPGMTRPLLMVSAPDSSSLLLLGQRHRSLLLRIRTRGTALRLATPVLALEEAFPAASEVPAGTDPRRGPHLVIRVRHTIEAVYMERLSAAGSRSRVIERTPLLGWMLLAPFDIGFGAHGMLLTSAWTLFLLLPGAYWSGRARSQLSWAPLAQLLGVLAALAIVSRIFSLSMPSGWMLVVVLIGTWGGAALGSHAVVASRQAHRQVTPS